MVLLCLIFGLLTCYFVILYCLISFICVLVHVLLFAQVRTLVTVGFAVWLIACGWVNLYFANLRLIALCLV